MKFQNPFELFNNYLDKSKNNIEPFDNEIEDVNNEIQDGLKGYAEEVNKIGIPKKEFDYGIGFMIIILIVVFVIQLISYGLSSEGIFMTNVLENPTWSFPSVIFICFLNFAMITLVLAFVTWLKFGIPMLPWQGLNYYNLMFIVFILTSVLLLGSHILFIFFPGFIEIFENTIGYSLISLGAVSSQITPTGKSLSAVFGDRLKIKALPGFNIGLEFLITYFTLSKFSESFLSFIHDVLSDGKNQKGGDVTSISEFSDFEFKNEFDMPTEFLDLINETKRQFNENETNTEIFDFLNPKHLDPSLTIIPKSKGIEQEKNINIYIDKIDKFKKDLFELTLAKYRIGSFCWSYFISVIIFIGSMNAFIT